MKIAVTTEGNQVFQHFGKCPAFTVFTIEGGKITARELLDASQNGHSALSGFLKSEGVETIICGGIGGGARNMLSSAGIGLVSGIGGTVEDAVKGYISGSLNDQGGSCDHHDHEEGLGCSCKDHCH